MSTEPAPPPAGPSSSTGPPPPTGLHHRLYRWVLHWAYTPHALTALVLLSFAESTFFPIPPDVLLIPLAIGYRERAFRFAFWCSVASVLGGMAGYGIGFFFWEAWAQDLCFEYLFTPAQFEHVEGLYGAHSFWIVFTAGLSPIPYKVFTITSGVFHDEVPFALFVLASATSRSARFFLVAWLMKRFGAPIQEFIEKRLGWMMLLFCLLLVGGFTLVEYVLR